MYTKKRIYLLSLLIGLILLPIIFSFESSVEMDTNFAEKSLEISDYSNPSAYPSIFQNPNFDQSQVPPEYISLIPEDKVDPNQVKDKSKLTKEQLEYNNNINEVSNWGELNQDVVSQILSDKTDKNVNVNNAGIGNVNDNSFSINSASSFSIDDTSFSSPQTINYNNNVIYVKSADNVVVKESTLNKIKEFYGGEDIFKTNAFDGLLILSDGTPVKYNSLEKDSEISLSTDDVIILKKGVLDDGQHTVISNSTEPTIITYEKGKIKCALIAPSTYILEDNEFYAIYEPADGVTFNMCFRNFPEQIIEMGECINCGLFDFIDDVYTLNGFIQFQKKPTLVTKSKEVKENYDNTNYNTEDYFIPIFDGKTDVTAMFYDIAYMDEFILGTLELNYLSYTNPSNYLRIKEENGRTYLSKADLLNPVISAPFLTNYIFNEHPAVMEGQIFVYDNLKIYPAGSERLKEVFN